jgi:asparagine N-glycosylation enzyme membrane subunit Stt3
MQRVLKRLVNSPIAAVIAAAGLRLIGLYSLFRWRPWLVVNPMMSGGEVTQIAKSIVMGKGFGNPLGIVDTGPTAWVCPVYPYIVAGFFSIGGIHTTESTLMLLALNCIFTGLTIFPIYAIAKHTFGTQTAIYASWIWVVLPSAWQIPIRLTWDSTLNALSFAVIFWATLAVRGQRAILKWVGYGALWAVCALINTSIMSLIPFFVAWILWNLYRQSKPWLRQLATALLVFVLGVAPWTLRNYMAFGKFIPLRSNFGLVLWMANHSESLGFDGFSSPYGNAQQATIYRQMGEAEYMRTKKLEAYAFMKSHPKRTLANALRNVWIFWFGVTDREVNPWYGSSEYRTIDFIANAAIISLGLVGILLALRSRNAAALLYLAVLIFFPPLYYLTRPGLRFRLAIEPILAVLAAYGAVCILNWLRKPAVQQGLRDTAAAT